MLKKIFVLLILINLNASLLANELIGANLNNISISNLSQAVNTTKEKLDDPRLKNQIVKATVTVNIKAPVDKVWSILTDFKNYPDIFTKIESCNILRQKNNLVYIESFLKPQMFVKQTCQHTINDLSSGPNKLSWYMLDGNFQYMEGSWKLIAKNNGKICQAYYTIKTIPGSVIPKSLVNVALNMVQHEVVNSLKDACEKVN